MASDTIANFRAGTLTDRIGVNVLVDVSALSSSTRANLLDGTTHTLTFDVAVNEYALSRPLVTGGQPERFAADVALGNLVNAEDVDSLATVCGAQTLARSGIRQATIAGERVAANVAIVRESQRTAGLATKGIIWGEDPGCLWKGVPGTIASYTCDNANGKDCIKGDYQCYYDEVTVIKGQGKIGVDGCKVSAGGTCSIKRTKRSVPIPVSGQCTENGTAFVDCLCVPQDIKEVEKKCQEIRDAQNAKTKECDGGAAGGTETPPAGGGTNPPAASGATQVAPKEICLVVDTE